ncbi:MAG: adenylate/guanylate cyclase domain-containing protein, partial [Chthoniobacteraceae bacterium]
MKPTLAQVFTLSLVGLAVALSVLFYVVFDASRATTIESSERIRDSASAEIGKRVTNFLQKAPDTVQAFQLALDRGLIDAGDPRAIERALFSLLLANPDMGELNLTYAHQTGFAENGAIELAETPRGQVTVWRAMDANGETQWRSRHVHRENGVFVADLRKLDRSGSFLNLPVNRDVAVEIPDPTSHPTFTTPARQDLYGRLVWSDLHWSEVTAQFPASRRRVEVSVQQVVIDANDQFVGVLRVGLLAQQLERAVSLQIAGATANDPHRIFICDPLGRLITRGVRSDPLEEFDVGLRVAAKAVPPPIATALADPRLGGLDDGVSGFSGGFSLEGEEFLTTFHALRDTQDWVVGIVVPRAFYLGKLTAMRNRLLWISSGIMVLLVVGGVVILRGARKAQSRITRESVKMNAFDFSPASTAAPFRDVSEVLENLEKAKTALRAMSKYVPIDLVRRLYRENNEPVLGGDATELSIMFTDIKDFTGLAEQFAPDDLAAALGRYLDTMARIIQQETGGTIDKYIGDAIMTIWNAPEPVVDHPRMACLAAVRCREAGRQLSQSPEWRGLPRFETRFGLHRDTALVGHFGAPDRMNYTAIGDAINLASRLEGLNKLYGTSIIASERIVEDARAHFDFRLLDRVAVKGKSESIRIYELLGEKGARREPRDFVANYEAAFEAYAARDFG